MHDTQDENNKLSGLKLLCQLSHHFSAEFLEGFVICDLVALSQDMNKNVRIAAINAMADIGKLFTIKNVVSKFYPE